MNHVLTGSSINITSALLTERDYQARRWGTRNPPPENENPRVGLPTGVFAEDRHEVGTFILFAQQHLQEAAGLASRSPSDFLALDALRKVYALIHACFEQHGVVLREPPKGVPFSTFWVTNARDGQLA